MMIMAAGLATMDLMTCFMVNLLYELGQCISTQRTSNEINGQYFFSFFLMSCIVGGGERGRVGLTGLL